MYAIATEHAHSLPLMMHMEEASAYCEGMKSAHHCPFANVQIRLLYAPAHRLLDGLIHLGSDALCPLNACAAGVNPALSTHMQDCMRL